MLSSRQQTLNGLSFYLLLEFPRAKFKPMELSSVIRCSIPLAFPTCTAARDFASPLSLPITNPVKFSSLNLSSKGTNLLVNQVGRFQHFLATAIVGNRTVVPEDNYSEGMLSSGTSVEACVDGNSLNTSEKKDDNDGAKCSDDHKMERVCDKLIDVFMVDKPTPTDWRRLIAFSSNWSNIRPHFFRRCEDRADSENDPGMKQKLLRLGRKLKEVDEDVQRHDELLQVIKRAPSEISEIVSKRRKDFTQEFFVYIRTVAESYYDNPKEQNDLAKLGKTCLAAVQAYDDATESVKELQDAQLKFQDILNSPSIDAACRKIDNLAEKSELDSTLVAMITKAWSAAKESNLVKDEAMDMLYHLYKTAVGNLQRLLQKEIRIIKYLVLIEDPEEQLSALGDAFTPGQELEGTDVDYLCTTPEKLHSWLKVTVDAFHSSGEGTLIRDARDLMNPRIIQKLEDLKKLVEKNFM